MSVLVGFEAKIYRNAGTFATPIWNEIQHAKDVTCNLVRGEADVTTRGNTGWKATRGTLKDLTIEMMMLWDTTSDDFAAIRDAFLNNTPIEILALDGPVTTPGSQGPRAECMVVSFTREEPLEEALSVSVSMRPTLTANGPPTWFTAP